MTFADAAVLHVERPRRTGEAVLRLNTEENPYHATIGLRIVPGRPGSGLRFVVDAPARDMPLYLFNSAEGFSAAIERHVRRSLRVGLLRLGRDRLRRDPDRVRLQHRGRAAVPARARPARRTTIGR